MFWSFVASWCLEQGRPRQEQTRPARSAPRPRSSPRCIRCLCLNGWTLVAFLLFSAIRVHDSLDLYFLCLTQYALCAPALLCYYCFSFTCSSCPAFVTTAYGAIDNLIATYKSASSAFESPHQKQLYRFALRTLSLFSQVDVTAYIFITNG